jgi:phage tail-like protein
MKRAKLALFAGLVLVVAPCSGASAAEFGGTHSTFTAGVGQGLDLYKNFRFLILMDGRVVAGASQMTGLDMTTQGTARGNPGPWLEKMPGRLRWEPITLERGATRDTAFENWAQGGARQRRNITIQIRDERGGVARSFTLSNCWVSQYQALPDLDASANAVAIEHIKLESEGWSRDDAVRQPLP